MFWLNRYPPSNGMRRRKSNQTGFKEMLVTSCPKQAKKVRMFSSQEHKNTGIQSCRWYACRILAPKPPLLIFQSKPTQLSVVDLSWQRSCKSKRWMRHIRRRLATWFSATRKHGQALAPPLQAGTSRRLSTGHQSGPNDIAKETKLKVLVCGCCQESWFES